MREWSVRIEIRRHGQWDYKEDKLTQEGRKEAEELAFFLDNFDLVLSSPTRRARETAEILSKGMSPQTTEILNEISGIRDKEEFYSAIAVKRAKEAIQFILNKVIQDLPSSVLVITSGGLLGAIQCYLERKTPAKRKDVLLFHPLNGICLSLAVKKI